MDVIFTYDAAVAVQKRTVIACHLTVDPTGQQVEGVWEGKHWAH